MFLFGHVGITLGAAVLGSGVYCTLQKRCQKPQKTPPVEASGQSSAGLKPHVISPGTWIENLNTFLDIRLLLVGSMLPDIIDKPIGHYFFDSTFHNGRIFSHTLIFLAVLMITGLWLKGHWGKTWLLALALGVMAHLILDQMWLSPQTLFWPFHGWQFPSIDDSNIIMDWFSSLFEDPTVYIPEIIGFAIVVMYGTWLWRRRKIGLLWNFRP